MLQRYFPSKTLLLIKKVVKCLIVNDVLTRTCINLFIKLSFWSTVNKLHKSEESPLIIHLLEMCKVQNKVKPLFLAPWLASVWRHDGILCLKG